MAARDSEFWALFTPRFVRISVSVTNILSVATLFSRSKAAQRNDLVGINATYVLNRLVEIDQMDVLDILTSTGELKPVSQWPKVWRTTLSGLDVVEMSAEGNTAALLKKIKWPDKVKNLELIGKHIDVQAFREQVKTEHVVESISDLMDSLSQGA